MKRLWFRVFGRQMRFDDIRWWTILPLICGSKAQRHRTLSASDLLCHSAKIEFLWLPSPYWCWIFENDHIIWEADLKHMYQVSTVTLCYDIAKPQPRFVTKLSQSQWRRSLRKPTSCAYQRCWWGAVATLQMLGSHMLMGCWQGWKQSVYSGHPNN